MTKKHPYSYGPLELPRGGAFLDEENAYPLLDQIEDLLYPVHQGRPAVVPQKVKIHPEIVARVSSDDLAGPPVWLVDEQGHEDEVLTLKPEAAERIREEVLAHVRQ
ncbi:hypothetical protein DFP74_2716 [Nocardiopsis sp. Huas11]|uniref:hypothetical protein n=1 Tax=Nocardiopsis sp. Huas11 TaxID=2183912 RepID=UPI000F299A97|nr:hypothetical protein [Nocardiopsis sp. Huas11]RKS07061.1 hypothetical protein DFP74_2716 [Nocardiopsis sp. Huas11]